jgi:hypothetical protein
VSNTGTENSSGEEGEIVVFDDSRELTYQQNHLQEDPFLSSRGTSFPIPNRHKARASPQHQVLQEWSKRNRQVYNNRCSHLLSYQVRVLLL